ncbi:TylF/MycF/NovP-related O-methyltransferase [Mesorhizobium sp. WSM3876]|uniref:TylF/MycF/NovP-related O-methyltransferase n=1 Tax=Mesorhizobium sp. WSM3876 TaxID=422277 RepID=UPI001AEC8613|nr:TylF/MycF/NovP-related O-methyltransferase [Mesorhizobium sp. WSM3876]
MSATVEKETRKRYLDLIEATVSNSIYGESGIERKIHAFWQRLRHPLLTKRGVFGWPPRAHTMLRAERLKNIRMLVEAVIEKGIPGDLIETGVWRGGACIYMRAILAAHGQSERKVVVADSFEGLPPPDGKKYPADKRDKLSTFDELAVSLDDVKRNFAAYGLLDSQVQFAKGFFKDTLGKLDNERFALIRLDGDMYESTMDALTALYDKVSPGGYVIVDDYGGITACRKAVHDFLDQRGLAPKIHKVDVSAVWWEKEDRDRAARA